MEMEAIYTLLGSYAFPIAMCILLFLQNRERDKNFNDTLHDLTVSGQKRDEKFTEALDNMKDIINNNTQTMTRLYDALVEFKQDVKNEIKKEK